MKIVPNAYEKVQFTVQEEKEFAYTEAFRQRVMMELKSNAEKKRIAALESPVFLEKTKKFDVYSVRPKVDVSPGRYTMTEGHLMLVLGHDYVEPTDFLDLSLHRQANIANLKRYFAKYNSMEFANKVATEGVDEEGKKAEFKRKLIVDDRFIERLADVMDVERQEWVKTGRFPVYHGTTDQNGHAFRIASIINNHLTLNATDHLTRLRYTDLYFREVANMAEDIARYGTDHYENGNRDRRLFGNFVLTAGRATSRSTSSTVEYWGNNHSVADPNVKKRFEEGTALLGMDLAYAYYESLFQQFIADTGTAYGNALLLQMFISPEALTGYGATDYMNEKVALTAYQNAQAEYKRIGQSGKEDFEPKKTDGAIDSTRTQETEKKKGLFGEVRLQLHPDMMRDPSQFTAYGLDFFPLDTAKQRRFNNGLSAVTAANLGHWFSQKTALIPGSLMETPTARNLYKMVYKSVTGDDMDDVPNTHSLLHLARFGHLEALETLIKACPDLVGSINPIQLFDAALASGSYTVTKHVVTEIIKRPVNEILDIKKILTKLQIETDGKLPSSFNYILKHYGFSTLPESELPAEIKREIADIILKNGNAYAVKLANREIMAFLEDDIKKAIISTDLNKAEWENMAASIIKRGLMTVEKMGGILLHHMKKASYNEQNRSQQDQLISLKKAGFNFHEIDPTTGNPFFFDFPYFAGIYDFASILDDGCLAVRNPKGLNVLEHVLTQYQKGCSVTYYFQKLFEDFIKRTNTHVKDHISPELYTFFKHKIDISDTFIDYTWWLSSKGPFAYPKSKAWLLQFKKALRSDHYPAIREVLEACPSSQLLSYYKSYMPEEMLTLHMKSAPTPHNYSVIKRWEKRVSNILNNGQRYSVLKKALADVPVNRSFEFYRMANPGLAVYPKIVKIDREKEAVKSQLVAYFDADPHAFMSKIKTIDLSLFGFQFVNNLFKDEFSRYMPDLLNQLFGHIKQEKRAKFVMQPLSDCFDISDSSSNFYSTPFIISTINNAPPQLKITHEILKWAGCEKVLKRMTQEDMRTLLGKAREDRLLQDFIFEQARAIFSSTKPGKDFLTAALLYFPEDKARQIAYDNMPALKELTKGGIPRVYFLIGGDDALLKELFSADPTLLDVPTSFALTIEDLSGNIDEDHNVAPYLKRLLKMKQTLAHEKKALVP